MTTAKQLLEKKTPHEIYSVSPNQSTYEALQLMASHNIGAIPVMENDRILGILTEREYARKIVLHGKASRNTPVRETMNPNFPRVSPEDSIESCMLLITEQRFRYVAVMDDDTLVGLISIGDVLKDVIANQQADIDHLHRYITGSL